MNWTFLYVATIYFAAIWMWRRGKGDFSWRIAGLFYLLTLAFFFPTLVLHYTTVPADQVLLMSPWRGLYYQGPAGNPEMNDVIMQMVPWAHQVRESWKQLEAPLWNSAAGGGYPLLANAQSGALAPFRLLSIPLDLASSFASESAFKVLVALTFGFLYMQRRGRSVLASVITAISYGFCTFLTIWLHYPHASVAAFLPAVFYTVDLLLDRASFRRVVFGAAVFTMLLLHGHPETAAHTIFAAGAYTLFCLLVSSQGWIAKLRSLAGILLAGFLSILLSLPFLLPFIEALPKSQRFEMVQAMGWRERPLPVSFVLNFIQPNLLGIERGRVLAGVAEVLSGYAGITGAVGWFGGLFYLIRRRQWRTSTAFYVLATPVLVAVVLRWEPFFDAIHAIPLYSMAANTRLRAAICWFLAVLAGEVIHLCVSREERAPLVFGLAAISTLLLVALLLRRFPDDAAAVHSINTTAARAVVLVAAGLLLVKMIPLRIAGGALIAVIALDLWIFGWQWYPPVPAKYLYPTTPLIAKLQDRQRNPEAGEIFPHRLTGTGAAFFPNAAAMYGLEDIRAHDPMAFGRVLGVLRVFTGYTSGEYFGFLQKIDHPFLDYLNVRYIIASPLEEYQSDRFIGIYSGPDGKLYKNRDALPRFFAARNVFVEFDDVKRTQMILEHRDWASSVVLKRLPTQLIDRIRDDLFLPRPPDAPIASVKILLAKPREFRLDVDAPRWTLIIGSQPNWPGWRIYRNGTERLKQIEVNGAFMGFVVPPGKSAIQVVYVPRSFYVGLYISLTTLGLLIAGLVGEALRRRIRK